jgi:hypothetical protein
MVEHLLSIELSTTQPSTRQFRAKLPKRIGGAVVQKQIPPFPEEGSPFFPVLVTQPETMKWAVRSIRMAFAGFPWNCPNKESNLACFML